MIAYLQGKDVTVDVPDDIGDKELGDMAKSFVPEEQGAPAAPTTPTQNSSPSGEAVKTPSAPARSWIPNFYESYIKPALPSFAPSSDTLEKGMELAGQAINAIPPEAGPAALPGELTSTPEARAFTGSAINAFTFGLTKPVINPLAGEDIQDHPVYATAGHLTGDLGSLLATGGLLKIAGLGAEATEIGAQSAKVLASAPRFLPRAIMTGATFGTKTFFEKTIKAFQDGGVDPAEFGKAVLLQSVGGAAFGAIGGIVKMPVAIASAAGVMFTMSKMEGGSNQEAGLSAAVAAAFEMVGSFGRSESLNREALKTVADSIGNYARAQDPTIAPEMASAIGDAIVEREAAKIGGIDAIVKGETGKENTLQVIEEINQKIRQGKVRAPIQDVKAQSQIETTVSGPSEASAPEAPALGGPSGALPAPETAAQAQTNPASTEPSLPAPDTSARAVSGESPNTVFPPTEVSSLPSIAQHPDFIKLTNDATAVTKHYAEQRSVEPTQEFAKNLWQEMHDAMGALMKAPADQRLAIKKQIDEKYPDIEREFMTLRDKIWSDSNEDFFSRSVAGKYGHLRPKLGIEAEDNVLRGTPKPAESPTENAPQTTPETSAKTPTIDEQGLPVRKPGAVVSTVDLLDGQKAKITHQMVLDEADALLSDAHDRRGTAGALEKFVLESGKIRSYKADEAGAVPEAEEMRDVPIRFKGGQHTADEMAQMAYDQGLLPEPDADLLRTELKAIPVRGGTPKLADFYDQAQRNLEEYFSNLGKPQEEQLPTWVTENQGGTDEIAAEKRAKYGVDQTETPKFKKWFGESKVVDESGKPLVLYHGTKKDFNSFDPNEVGSYTPLAAKHGVGFYFSDNPKIAEAYAETPASQNARYPANIKQQIFDKGGNIKPVYLSLQNPLVYDAKGGDFETAIGRALSLAKRSHKDGVIIKNVYDNASVRANTEIGTGTTYIAFKPEQIKSAIGNSGEFNPESPNIAAQPAYHGSPYRFDKFELQKIGTGEGNQAFGWGLYFAGKKDVAEYYRDALSARSLPTIIDKNGHDLSEPEILSAYFKPGRIVKGYGGYDRVVSFEPNDPKFGWYVTVRGVIKQGDKWVDAPGMDGRLRNHTTFPEYDQIKKVLAEDGYDVKKGHLYNVDIPDDNEFLDHDKILADQSKSIQQIAAKISKELKLKSDPYEITGEQFYNEISEAKGGDETASRYLTSNGIPGLKYLDQGSRQNWRILSPSESVSGKWVVGVAPNGPNTYFANEVDAREAFEKGNKQTSNYVIFDDKHVKVLKVEEPQASPYQQQFDFQKNPDLAAPSATTGTPAEHTVAGGFKAIMQPHLEVEFKKTGAVMIPNHDIQTPADLAYAFKTLHNEAQENFFLGAIKNNRIVAVEHMGFGTIDQVAVYPFETINLIDKNDADGFFIVHNHPSGEVNPSEEDKNLTSAIRRVMEKNGVEFKGHVIIDDTKFGFIDPDGTVSTQTHKEYAKTQELPVLRKHFDWLRSKDSIKNGVTLNSPSKAFELFKGIQQSDQEGMAYLLDTQNRILNAVVLPKSNFNAGTLQRLAAAYRSPGILTVNSGLDDTGYQILRNDLRDAQIRLLDDISYSPDKTGGSYQSKLERLGEARAAFNAAKEKAGEYSKLPENPAERYQQLIQEAKERGMKPREARAWAKEQILQNADEPTVFPPTRETPVPTFKDTVDSIKEAGGEIRDLVAPAKSAPLAGEILRENLAKVARSYDKAEKALETASKLFDSRSAALNTDFIDKMEHGEEQETPDLSKIAQTLRKIFDDKRAQIQALGTGKLKNFIENYFPHIWDQSPKVVSKATMKAAKRPLEGSKAFLKKRTIEFFKDGITLGLTPISYNPVELTLLKLREMDKYLAAHSTLNSLKEEGLAKFVRIGGDIPEGFTKLDDKISTVMRKTDEGMVITGHYYVQADAARLINNYLKPGLQKFALYRGYRYAGNLMNQFQLGFSAFHLGFTSMDAIVSKAALAINQLALGHPLRAIADAIRSPIAPLENILRGDRVIKAWYGDGQFGKGTEEVVAQALESAGGRVRMDPFYATKAWDQMQKYFRMGSPIRGLLHIPLALTEITSKPILEYIVPRQKLGIFADIVRMEMEHNPTMTHDELRTLAQRAWDSVDNRMGQLVYDNLFWNKTFKDLLMGSVRSVGWNLGTIRELGGGAADVAKIPFKMAKGESHAVSYKAAYFFALPIITGLFGAVYQYLRTGKGPEQLKDYFFPRTGGSDQFGMPNRVSLPSYMKDLYHYKEAPVDTVLNKLNPLLAMTVQMYHNKDFYGVKIRNEDDPFMRQILAETAYLLKQTEPFGLRNMQRNLATGNKSLSDIVEPWIGVTPAPYDVNQTKAEKLAHLISAEKIAIGGRTQAQADHTTLMRDLANKFRAKDPGAVNSMHDAFQSGQISTNDMTRLIRDQRLTPIQRLTSNFSADELQRVFNVATPEEKAQLDLTLRMKDIRHKSHYVPQGTK